MSSSNEEILRRFEMYRMGALDMSFSETAFQYKNNYISVVSFSHSNEWLGIPHESEMIKMWSIIYRPKKDFSELKGWKILSNHLGYDLYISPVHEGRNRGCSGIRIKGMRQRPDEEIIRDVLDLIFQ